MKNIVITLTVPDYIRTEDLQIRVQEESLVLPEWPPSTDGVVAEEFSMEIGEITITEDAQH